jgi:hypothetical protein
MERQSHAASHHQAAGSDSHGQFGRGGLSPFFDGRLVAIIVRLAEPSHGNMKGRWFLECGFGDWYTAPFPEPFADADAAERWLMKRIESR